MKILTWLSSLTSPLRRLRRRLVGCCLLIALGLLLACATVAYLAGRASAQTEPPGATDVLLLIDHSNSMFERSDPDLRRLEAARLFLTYLGIDSSRLRYRLGVITFGSEAHLVVPLTPLADETRRTELTGLLAGSSPLGWTDPAAALRLAAATLPGAAGQQALVLLTDGKPELSSRATPAETAALVADLRDAARVLAQAGIPLFVILLQDQAAAPDPATEEIYVPLWQELAAATPPGRFYRTGQSEDLLDLYHDIIITLTQRQTDGVILQTTVQTKTLESATVEPHLAQVTFVIRKSRPGIEVAIRQPNGRILQPGQAGVQQAGQDREEIWAIAEPQPGQWQIELSGQGQVTIWKDFYPAPTPTPTATLTPTSTPPPTFTTTPSPSPTVSPTPFPTLTSTPTPTATVPPPPSPPPSPLPWWIGGPLLALGLGGSGWAWRRWQQTRPRLSGTLHRLGGPDDRPVAIKGNEPFGSGRRGQPTAAWTGDRLDLDRLNRTAIELASQTGAGLTLPHRPDQPTPTVRLVARREPDGSTSVNLTPPPTGGPSAPRVNDLPVTYERPLQDGDLITLGAYRFKYENLRQRRGHH